MTDSKERDRLARAYFRDGYNCCQSVALAFKDVLEKKTGITEDQIKALTGGFGGGMGRLREVCGAVSGMTFTAGALSPAVNPDRQDEKTANYALVQKLAGKFREEQGSIVCRELLNIRADRKEAPVPSTRTAEWYTTRPCERLVGCAARILAEELESSDQCPNL